MTAKKYLGRAEKLLDKINSRKTMINEKYSAAECKGLNYDSIGSRGSSGNSTENAYINARAFEEEVEKQLLELNNELIEIKSAILSVEDGTQEKVLTKHFIEGMSFDDIALEINYSTRQVIRIYNQGLAAVEKILKNK